MSENKHYRVLFPVCHIDDFRDIYREASVAAPSRKAALEKAKELLFKDGTAPAGGKRLCYEIEKPAVDFSQPVKSDSVYMGATSGMTRMNDADAERLLNLDSDISGYKPAKFDTGYVVDAEQLRIDFGME